jgi:hypothetical protein
MTLTEERKKELTEQARAIDARMAPLRKLSMSDQLVELNEQRAKILNELYGWDGNEKS